MSSKINFQKDGVILIEGGCYGDSCMLNSDDEFRQLFYALAELLEGRSVDNEEHVNLLLEIADDHEYFGKPEKGISIVVGSFSVDKKHGKFRVLQGSKEEEGKSYVLKKYDTLEEAVSKAYELEKEASE